MFGRGSSSNVRNRTKSNESSISKYKNGNALNSGITIPIRLEIELAVKGGQVNLTSGIDAGNISIPTSSSLGISTLAFPEGLKEPFVDKEYEERVGFDEKFLDIEVKLPTVKDKSVLAPIQKGKNKGSSVIPYQHFSIALHKYRRMALYSAANICTEEKMRRPDESKNYSRRALSGLGKHDFEKWVIDSRISDRHQLPDIFYSKDRKAFDKGHVVRRDAVCWGKDYDELRRANGDTYHTTNCSPQVLHFNRSNRGGLWGKLENYVFDQIDNSKACVFAGPILRDNDPIFEGLSEDGHIDVPIPQSFWKLIVVNDKGKLKSFAFVLDQNLDDVDFTRFETYRAEEFMVSDKWVPYLTPIKNLEKLLEIVEFDTAIKNADQYDEVKKDDVMKEYCIVKEANLVK